MQTFGNQTSQHSSYVAMTATTTCVMVTSPGMAVRLSHCITTSPSIMPMHGTWLEDQSLHSSVYCEGHVTAFGWCSEHLIFLGMLHFVSDAVKQLECV